ncbi:RNA polymerase sigma factor [Gimesia benthica]|uniref:RNA polymerase sigma factor n=1 Tax=Gimesia benthica TaxID=2608982 RepID=UPI001885A145|nr:sigma-70 family RNA polymerase sigma factor [Gimesia benthica]
MTEFPETVDSLIVRLRDPSNRAAWDQFEELYRPVIFRIARAKGLQHADALDLVQQVLISVASAISNYEKQGSGVRFRNWLSRITRNAILKAFSRQPRDRATGGSGILDVLSELPDADPETDAMINLEYRRELFHRAAGYVRGEILEATWLAFEMSTLQQNSIERTADFLAVSTGSVYAARSRVMRQIRNTVIRLENSDFWEEINHEHEPNRESL